MRGKIGVIGGGQLGRMAIEEARKYLADIEVLSPDYPSPAADLADAVHVGPIDDYESVMEFAEELDIVSYEIEGVSVEALFELERRGKAVLPPAGVLAEIKDKSRQKRLLDAAGVPTARWELLPDPASPAALEAAASRLGGFPIVQKACLGGYDGRGVAVLSSAGDAALKGPSLAEERIDFAKELAVVVAFAPDGSSAVYPCVEMAFDARANLCDSVLAPAREPGELRRRAEALALEAVRALGRAAGGPGAAGGAGAPAGVFAVEMFLAKDGRLLVNEIAPRPHNSGHYTIEACASSQFDQYV
ncbi:MAG TPA: ATP-grasp domain-containing protein, partial [Spirochaetia bacterium]|nr:ATP-grasp domain-containing protein [Spirochaetia bacterium]